MISRTLTYILLASVYFLTGCASDTNAPGTTGDVPMADVDAERAWVSYEQNDPARGRKRETRLMERVDGKWKIAGMQTIIYGK